MFKPNRILLDTHIWLWLMSGSTKAISPKLRSLIEELAHETAVRVSAISVWEVGMLAVKNRISFPGDIREWVFKALNAPGIGVEALTSEIAIDSVLIFKGFHGDPADRILLATARHIGASLVTHDKEMLSYSKKHGFSAFSL